MAVVNSRALSALVDGARQDGGATVDLAGNPPPDRGYMVGCLPDANRQIPVDDLSISDVHRWLQAWLHRAPFGTFLGSWLDTDTGLVHLDFSRWVEHEGAALALARDLGEIAIWDIVNGKEIRA